MLTAIESQRNIAQLIESLPYGKGTIANFWLSLQKSYYLWDPWILKDRDCYRMFYLAAPKPSVDRPFWSQGTIYGAVSQDMRSWQPLGEILAPNPANEWEAGRMLAGCTYQENGTYYLFYSASGAGDLLGEERIGLATSTDGIHWQRRSNLPLFSSEEINQWYGKSSLLLNHLHWRDPYLVKDSNSGKYYLFICAYAKAGAPFPYRGCIGLAVADRVDGPYKLLPPVVAAADEIEQWPFAEMERPQVIYRDGKYHLFFSCWPRYINPNWQYGTAIKPSPIDSKRISDSSIYHYVADSICGPFRPASTTPIVTGSEKTGMYGVNFFPAPNHAADSIACGWYYRLFTLEASPLFRVNWQQGSIAVQREKR